MTRLTDLKTLRDAVRDGREADAYPSCKMLARAAHDAGDYFPSYDVIKAGFRNDMNAALALFAALLPGWIGDFDTTGFAMIWPDEHPSMITATALVIGDPARALLLAVLEALATIEALIAKEEG